MKKAKIRFCLVSIFVRDLDESMHFYKRLGFQVDDIDSTETYSYCDLRLSNDDTFTIRLKQDYSGVKNAEGISFEFMADEDNGVSHAEAYDDLLNYGFKFTNIKPWELYKGTIYNVAELRDPDGYCLKLVDTNTEN